MPAELGLVETLAALRRKRYLPSNKKILIVIDQFEQWLHARKDETNTELVQALRQCDGRYLQSIVLVRDDFWMAATRFMRDLEIRLVEGQNSAAVDLFDVHHARKVLLAFGRAYGKLPDKSKESTRDQTDFLTQSIAGLAQESKVISVRLALFAEMMKGKEWSPASLKAVGGTAGVGVTFLEETFSAATAPPEHRYHQKAARAVLQTLLPESGTDIKGHMRSAEDLLAASGYKNRPRDFEDLLRILDSEIRLITPTDPEGTVGQAALPVPSPQRFYQLTHDYLVPSLRDWLTRKQKETPRGRAQLLLADRAAVWSARPETRQLPSLLQWQQIRRLTDKKTWTPSQRKMMARARRHHLGRILLVGASALVLALIGYEVFGRVQANKLVEKVLIAKTEDVPEIVQQMPFYRRWVNPLLRIPANNPEDPNKQLHASLALLPADAGQFDFLYDRLLKTDYPEQLRVIRDGLRENNSEELVRRLTQQLADEKNVEVRFRAATALADCGQLENEAQTAQWQNAAPAIVEQLLQRVRKNPSHFAGLLDLIRPAKTLLNQPLGIVYRDKRRGETERTLATSILADYAADQPPVLADLLMDGEDKQFNDLFGVFQGKALDGLPLLMREIAKKVAADVPSSDESREVLAKRQANAAVALLRLNKPDLVWPLLKHSQDPRVRSYLIHKLSPLGADAKAIVQQLEVESNITIRRALLLALGEFAEKDFTKEEKDSLIAKVRLMYQQDPDAGLHAAAEWLLRTWNQEAWLKEINSAWAKDNEERAKKLTTIGKVIAKDEELAPRQWYVNTLGQTMVVIPGPVVFPMGTPESEKDHRANETRHKRRIGRSFALAAKSVTLGEYRTLTKSNYDVGDPQYNHRLDLPVNGINWTMAAAYCNLLSKAEGVKKDQWCYETDAKGQVTELKANYLQLQGYRLPTEAEMEYATRAESVTSRYYGETEDLLGKYAWYTKNTNDQMQPVGYKKPNDFGLFDTNGCIFNWCQEPYDNSYGIKGKETRDDEEVNDLVIKSTVSRVLRGGSFLNLGSYVRSGSRYDYAPTTRNYINGFRLARTFTP